MAQAYEKSRIGPSQGPVPMVLPGADAAACLEREVTEAYAATMLEAGIEAPPAVWRDDRRMHMRAIGLWRQAAGDKPCPSITDFSVDAQSDYADNALLLALHRDDRPQPVYIGKALRALQPASGNTELAASHSQTFPQTLFPFSEALDRQVHQLLAHVLAERAPLPFEIEFSVDDGRVFLSRGVLLPFTGAGTEIDYVYGMLRWREAVDASVVASIADEVNVSNQRAVEKRVRASQAARGREVQHSAQPDSGLERTDTQRPMPTDTSPTAMAPTPMAPTPMASEAQSAEARGAAIAMLAHLARARASARLIPSGDIRGRAALYRALGFAYDFALATEAGPDGYQALLSEAGIRAQARAPMTAIVKLVFGPDYDKTRLAEFSAALGYARRHGLPSGGMALLLEQFPGGLKGVVLAERQHRGPGRGPRTHADRKGEEEARRLSMGPTFALSGEEEFAVVLVRRLDRDTVGVIGAFPGADPMVDLALKAVFDQSRSG